MWFNNISIFLHLEKIPFYFTLPLMRQVKADPHLELFIYYFLKIIVSSFYMTRRSVTSTTSALCCCAEGWLFWPSHMEFYPHPDICCVHHCSLWLQMCSYTRAHTRYNRTKHNNVIFRYYYVQQALWNPGQWKPGQQLLLSSSNFSRLHLPYQCSVQVAPLREQKLATRSSTHAQT